MMPTLDSQRRHPLNAASVRATHVSTRSRPHPFPSDVRSVADPRDIVDIEGLRSAPGAADARPPSRPARPFLMIWFRCCATYGRVPKSHDGTRYTGRCPKCLAQLEIPVGEGGTSRRMFEAG